jgi:hypothetical protein
MARSLPWLSEEHEPAYPLIYLPSDNLQFWVRHLDECHSISAYITLFLVACPRSSDILHLFFPSNIMLCGKFDRRRGGHRCMACRRAHKKVCGFLAPTTRLSQTGRLQFVVLIDYSATVVLAKLARTALSD